MVERTHSLPCDGDTAEDAVWSAVEHLVDTTGCSYDDAWRRFDIQPGDSASPQENVGREGKKTREYQSKINRRGIALCRAALQAARERRRGYG